MSDGWTPYVPGARIPLPRWGEFIAFPLMLAGGLLVLWAVYEASLRWVGR